MPNQMVETTKTYNVAEFVVKICELGQNRREILVSSTRTPTFIPRPSIVTEYPVSLIERILKIKGADYLCDEIAREEDPEYVAQDLIFDLNAYFRASQLEGKRILDFGSGSGASTMILSRLFPACEIVGVELDSNLCSIAQARREIYNAHNVKFLVSPSGSELPGGIGMFDLVIMSAVFEHLLPGERKTVMPLVWNVIREGGHLFMNMTPNRYFPIEHHTTNLPLINFFPDSLTYWTAKTFSKRLNPHESWEEYLRRGIRGGSVSELLGLLGGKCSAELLNPEVAVGNDRVDLWYARLNQSRLRFVKSFIRLMLKLTYKASGVAMVPNLSIVFRKRAI